jgi:hypothetical protein
MPPNLNNPQRILLALVGVAIFLVQLYKFDDYGVEGSGWVVAFLVGAILILPSLSLIKIRTKKERDSQEQFKNFINQSSRTQIAFKRIRAKSEELKKLVVKESELPDAPSLAAINYSMTEEWGRNCFMYVAALSAAAEVKQNPGFLDNQNFVVFEAQVIREALNSSKQSAISEGFGEQHDDNRVKAYLIKDWNLAKSAMMRFLDNLASNKQVPDEPLLVFFFEKIGAPDVLRKKLEMHMHEFTKNTLREFVRL